MRRDTYKHLFVAINANERDHVQHRFLQHSATSSLARANVIKIVLEQWVKLQAYFKIVIEEEKSYIARVINDMLHDNIIFIYLTIVFNILMNGLFQMDNGDSTQGYKDLYQLLLNNLLFIIKLTFLENLHEINQDNFKHINEILLNQLAYIYKSLNLVNFGNNFRESVKNYQVEENESSNIKTRSAQYVKIFCFGICKRISENLHVFKASS